MMNDEVTAYVNEVPAGRRERFDEIVRTITRLVPKVEAGIEYKMPAFRRGDALVSVANRKGYISIYTSGSEQTEAFRRKYPKIKGGVGCVNIKDSDEFDPDDLKLITDAVFG